MKAFWTFCAVLLISQFCIVPVYGYDFSVWDWSHQCHGDADGTSSAGKWVTTSDLAILYAIASTPPGDWPAVWPGSANYDPRADFDRNFKVDDLDVNILELYWGQSNVPGDCGKKLELTNVSPSCLLANTFYTISWTWRIYTEYVPLPGDEDHPGTMSLYYSINNGTNWTLITTVSSGTSYDWQVPEANSTQCLLKIVDGLHTGLTDNTSTFNIHTCQAVEGDVNNDCYVDMYDLLVIAEYWLGEECTEANDWCEGADFEPNTIVNLLDYSTFARNWRLCGNPCDSNCTE